MNNFELYKLKRAGLTNQHILNILAYQKQEQKSLSLRDMIVVSGCQQPIKIIESYKQLDSKQLRQEFNQFPHLSILDKEYPLELKQIHNPPVLLFYQGNLELLTRAKLAIVGSRNCSTVGVKSVKKIISELGNRFVIVSGLARGIDTAAHIASLKNGGSTIAVIGTGLATYYPKENKALQDYIAKHHLVLSEYHPQAQPLNYHFPQRNRIIAGLSKGVVVVEAKQRSGSLITCERALEEGRDVFAVPGNIIEGLSDGCHHLIKEGAICTSSGYDILSEYAFLE
ncbi:DNA-processing protein DprA [Streptococcus cuniculipharyngis]|uniref:DNA-protecting protein DprA n=1 Tax=Streptococcus cuniculipharyngis TaxID=1562651 RepID=A0A5C5SEZ6_9STRE|nr:DNA-processing protein DprA [Streptococcus cuniculipharyngis]TWS98870.1 DNA-protecting protein DprA [Streptococcus cuniculipharyngis]